MATVRGPLTAESGYQAVKDITAVILSKSDKEYAIVLHENPQKVAQILRSEKPYSEY